MAVTPPVTPVESQSSWTGEDVLSLFKLLEDMEYVLYYMLGGIFGLIALVLLLIFFVTFKK